MSSPKQWYAVYTKPQAEKKVVEYLFRKEIESFCPFYQQPQRLAIFKKGALVPLFKSYVFVKINEKEIRDLLRLDTVINIIYWLGQPAVIKEIEINMMRQFLEDHQNVQLKKVAVNMNAIVRIIKELDNDFMKKEIVRLVLPSLGYELIAEENQINMSSISRVKIMNERKFDTEFVLR